MKNVLCAAVVVAIAAFTGFAHAQPMTYQLPDETADFKPGPGVENAQNNCMTCHSADYISTQPPKKGEAFWSAAVNKMIKTYHAPIEESEIKAIVDYLSATY